MGPKGGAYFGEELRVGLDFPGFGRVGDRLVIFAVAAVRWSDTALPSR